MKYFIAVLLLLIFWGCGTTRYQVKPTLNYNPNELSLDEVCAFRGHVPDGQPTESCDLQDEVVDTDTASYLIKHMGVTYHYTCLRCGKHYNNFKAAYSDTIIVWSKK